MTTQAHQRSRQSRSSHDCPSWPAVTAEAPGALPCQSVVARRWHDRKPQPLIGRRGRSRRPQAARRASPDSPRVGASTMDEEARRCFTTTPPFLIRRWVLGVRKGASPAILRWW